VSGSFGNDSQGVAIGNSKFGSIGASTSDRISSDHRIWSLDTNIMGFDNHLNFQLGDLRSVSGGFGAFLRYDEVLQPFDMVCFEKDTPIETSKGNKFIQSIKIGDIVRSWDEASKQFVWKKVTNFFERVANSTFHIKLSNGELMKVTPEHVILVNRVWKKAGEIKVGDKLLGLLDKEIEVLEIKQVNKKVKVYNFEVEDTHTYIAHGAVVHNKCWVNTKDGKTLSVSDKEYAQLIKDGKEPQFVNTESGHPKANNPNNPINQAFKAAEKGQVLDFDYTPEEFIEFIQSEDGYKAFHNNSQMKEIISDHYKAIVLGSAAGIVFGEIVGAFKQVFQANKLNTRFVSNSKGETVDLKPTLDRISAGIKYPHKNDGTIFRNRESKLPIQRSGYYTEYVVPTSGLNHAGLQRLVIGKSGEIFYTPNHYETFIRIK
jgi:filamentous hemagglutinin